MKKKYTFSIKDKPMECEQQGSKITDCLALSESIIHIRNESYYYYKEVHLALLSNIKCQREYKRVIKELGFVRTGSDMLEYLYHKGLFSDESIFAFKKKMEALEYPTGKNTYFRVKSYKSRLLFNVLNELTDMKTAMIIAYNRYNGNLGTVDIAKCIVAYAPINFRIYIDTGEVKKNVIKSLTVEQGFDINVEELL